MTTVALISVTEREEIAVDILVLTKLFMIKKTGRGVEFVSTLQQLLGIKVLQIILKWGKKEASQLKNAFSQQNL